MNLERGHHSQHLAQRYPSSKRCRALRMKKANQRDETESKRVRIFDRLVLVASAVFGSLIGGLFLVWTLNKEFEHERLSEEERLGTVRNAVRMELNFNYERIPELTSKVQGTLIKWRANQPNLLIDVPLMNVMYLESGYPRGLLFSAHELKELAYMHGVIARISQLLEGQENYFMEVSRQFGKDVAHQKMVERNELLLDQCLLLQFELFRYTSGIRVFDTTLAGDVAKFKSDYFSSYAGVDSMTVIELLVTPK